ncbi:molybdenum cofactor guanylyltransferase [Rubeoparvulum massiliense]|uniref:molybdenum cofactor guanylyltransferase n=1 Tax=Rubeoparvulum massiliense TaxID=1631346 RepID=UPI00065DF46A|nr:molybdenum cofactor guanylyltransferase [Rubeoparvulum massiliense]
MLNATAIILAGGKSSRMGTNKALLPVGGEQNITRLRNRLQLLFPEVLLVTNDPETYQFLQIPITTDRYPGQGPLAGIHAGLDLSSNPYALVIACDMPFISQEIAHYLVEQAEGFDAVVPRIEGQLHPLFAVYRSALVPVIEECLKSDQLRMNDLLEQVKVRYIDEKELENAKLTIGEAFYNMNRPEEYERAQQIAEQE